MKGLALAKSYWLSEGEPAFRRSCPEVLEQAAIGLVGEGSECFGFYDEISRDHDWGPRFCVWLPEEAPSSLYRAAQDVYDMLPDHHLGYARV